MTGQESEYFLNFKLIKVLIKLIKLFPHHEAVIENTDAGTILIGRVI